MDTACPGLGEGLPERRNPGKDSFQAEPRALKQWVAALPLANASATARLLYQALRLAPMREELAYAAQPHLSLEVALAP